MLHQKHESYKYVLPQKKWVDWLTTRQEKNVTNSKMCILKKMCPKIKKIFFPLVTTFYNFALKIETSWAKRVVKPILESWNAANVIAYVSFIHSLIKTFKNMQCKEE